MFLILQANVSRCLKGIVRKAVIGDKLSRRWRRFWPIYFMLRFWDGTLNPHAAGNSLGPSKHVMAIVNLSNNPDKIVMGFLLLIYY